MIGGWIDDFFAGLLQHLGYVVLVAIAGSALAFILAFGRGWVFLVRARTSGRIVDYVLALARFMRVVRASLPRRPSLRAARLLAEVEILDPLDDRPSRYDQVSEDDFRGKLAAWRKDRDAWRRKTRILLRDLIRSDRERSRKLEEGAQERGDNPSLPAIPLKNTSMIDARRAKIRRYFEVTKSLKEDRNSFIAQVRVKNGFFAPTFLVAGILARFKQDWETIIDNYRHEIAEEKAYSPELVELRSFEFNCWLLWDRASRCVIANSGMIGIRPFSVPTARLPAYLSIWFWR